MTLLPLLLGDLADYLTGGPWCWYGDKPPSRLCEKLGGLMKIEAKLLNPGEAEVEMKIVMSLDEWCQLRAKMRGGNSVGSAACYKLDKQIEETVAQLRTVVSGENSDE